MEVELRFMKRALQLARGGDTMVSPNPMVGAVIIDRDGRIIGEGWHRKWGEGHAEVNAVASVTDKSLLHDCTMYVTLEPCSHYGKTPPCAELIIRSGIPRVVVGCLDPFVKVAGRGVRMLREAGVEVVVPFMEDECKALNRRFMTAHTEGRPFVLLKYAMSSDGYIDTPGPVPARWSSPATMVLMHAQRARYDAILVGSGTVLHDDPRLDVRLGDQESPRRQPLKVILDRRGRITDDYRITRSTPPPVIYRDGDLKTILSDLYSRGITSLMVEGGAEVLRSFYEESLWDEVRVEVAPMTLREALASAESHAVNNKISGDIPLHLHVGLPKQGCLISELTVDGRRIFTFRNT